MHSFRYQFREIQRLNPFWSSWVCFCETLKKLKIKNKRKIRKYFNQLVGKSDYAKTEKPQLINYLASPEFWE